MKVCHIINGEFYAGAEKVQELLFDQLSKNKDIKIHIVVIKKGKFISTYKPPVNIVIHDVSDGVIRKVKCLIKKEAFDIIHSHSPMTLLLAHMSIAARHKCKVIHHAHSPVLLDTENKIKNYIKYCIEYLFTKFFETHSICVSEYVKKESSHLTSNSKSVEVVHNGVPIKSDTSKSFNNEDVVIGFLGLIRKRKGIEVLIEALSTLPENYTLNVIGEFESETYKKEIEELITKLDLKHRVKKVGFKKDIYPDVKKLDFLVIPSLYGEGLPMVLLESMSIGVPTICSSEPCFYNVICNKETGLLFRTGDAGDLAKTIKNETSVEKLKSISSNAIAIQRRDYSDVNMANKIVKVYKRLCND